ncbi:DExH-box ATP-dependent RNA helicase DExH11, partial [Tanacetum coccineum]
MNQIQRMFELQKKTYVAFHLCIMGELAIEEYFEWYLEAEIYGSQITEKLMQSSVSLPFIQPGRVVAVKSQS